MVRRSDGVRPQLSQIIFGSGSVTLLLQLDGQGERGGGGNAYLDTELATPSNDLQRRFDGGQPERVVAAFGVEEEVLHVDDDEGGDGGGYGYGRLAWPLGRAQLVCGPAMVAGQVVGFGLAVVVPFFAWRAEG